MILDYRRNFSFFKNLAWLVATARKEKSRKASDRRSVRKFDVHSFSIFLTPRKKGEGERGGRGKSSHERNISLLGGGEKWRGSSALGWSGSAKIIGFLVGCRHHAVYLSVEMAATNFFFFFFLDTAKRAISVRSWKRAVWIFIFLVSRSKLSYFQRFLKFSTRSRAQSFGFAKEKWEKYILRYPTLDIRAIHFSKIEEENESDFQRYVEFLYKF